MIRSCLSTTLRNLRRLVPLVGAVLTLALVATTAPAFGAEPHVVPVFTHFVDDGAVTPGTLLCPGGQAIRGRATFAVKPGDTWQGTSAYDLCLAPGPVPNTLSFHGTETYTGSVGGCGNGTITYSILNGLVRQEANPTAPNGFQEWRIVPGGGTGGLAGVSGGQGVGVFTILPTLTNDGFFAGFLSC